MPKQKQGNASVACVFLTFGALVSNSVLQNALSFNKKHNNNDHRTPALATLLATNLPLKRQHLPARPPGLKNKNYLRNPSSLFATPVCMAWRLCAGGVPPASLHWRGPCSTPRHFIFFERNVCFIVLHNVRMTSTPG